MQILLLPDLSLVKTGGPSTFQRAFSEYLRSTNHQYTFEGTKGVSHCLIINGSRRWFLILKCFFYRIPITVRLGSRYRSNLLYSPSLLGSICYLPRLVSIHVAIFFASTVIFQSNTVKKQWAGNFLMKHKRQVVIYNAAPKAEFININRYVSGLDRKDINVTTCINLIALEATHPPRKYSLPFAVYDHLKSHSVPCALHIIGNLPEGSQNYFEAKDVIVYGHVDRKHISGLVSDIYKPIYIPSDNITGGCPNALLELQSLGVPAIVYRHTPSCEIIELTKGGCVVDCVESDLIHGRHVNLNHFNKALEYTILNYVYLTNSALSVSRLLPGGNIFAAYLNYISR